MKRLFVFMVGLTFIFCASAFAVDQPTPAPKAEPAKAAPVKAAPAKVAKMRARGVVKEITDTTLTIDVKAKGKVETKEFNLEKPVAKIMAGDKVTVNYVEKDGKMVALKVKKHFALGKKHVKKAPAKEVKPEAPAEAAPTTK